MRIDILTVLPQLLHSPFETSILKRAQQKQIVEIHIHDIRNYSTDKHRKVDDYQFGGGAGMVLQIEPIYACIQKLQNERVYDEIIYVTPDGETFNQKTANTLSMLTNIIIICGHYKGIDNRIREHIVTKEISIGDFVITGGELAAAVITDSVVRLLPGAMSDISSALNDSFQDNLLAPPVYTRPEVFNSWKVPDILLSGNTKAIEQWQLDQSLERTRKLRPDLLKD
ncbi:MAG TPA: tRNA (guanosine(37)-N1)-methyltransferase TrmD [Bacteroidales bacterium]|nr:MAG: tRNA (guanine-N(1)-)-methyltransferase [Bacteroidetes bacterium ADurb.Bin217]HPM12259.1 tRNA (guanosine(37)-N1)-methyltransferase TrmD [Bacteroidales bacterium]